MKRGREGDFLWERSAPSLGDSPQGGCYHMLFNYGKIKGMTAYLITPKDNYSKKQKLRE